MTRGRGKTIGILLTLFACTTLPGPWLLSASAQSSEPSGRLLMVRAGVAWVWEGGSVDRLFGDGSVSDARWSPNGDRVLYVENQAAYSDLMVWGSVTGESDQLTDNAPSPELEPGSQDYVNRSSWVRDPSWSSSGRIGFASDYEESGRMALWLKESIGADAVLAPEFDPSNRDIEGVSMSSSGLIAAYTERTFDGAAYSTTVVLRDLNDGLVYPLLDDVTGAFDPAISPDEQWVAMTIRSAAGVSDIWIVSRSGLEPTQITLGAQAIAAAWSPDGEWLAYLRPNGDGFELMAIPVADGAAVGEPISLGAWDDLDATSGLSWTAFS